MAMTISPMNDPAVARARPPFAALAFLPERRTITTHVTRLATATAAIAVTGIE